MYPGKNDQKQGEATNEVLQHYKNQSMMLK